MLGSAPHLPTTQDTNMATTTQKGEHEMLSTLLNKTSLIGICS